MTIDEASPAGVIVTGATGWIGRRVASHLHAQGVPVVAVGRSAAIGPWKCFWELDITDERRSYEPPEALGLADSWALVHCAGLAHKPYESASVRRQMHRVNALGTQNVMSLCRRLDVTRVVYVSSISVYDWRSFGSDAPRSEEAVVAASSAYAESKLAGELAVRASGLHWTIVRLATVFGEGDRANFAKLARSLRRGVFVIPGAGDARKSVISVDDAAQCLAAMATTTLVDRQTLNLAYVEAPTLKLICEELAAVCGGRQPSSVPVSVLKCLACCGDLAQRLGLTAPLCTATLQKLITSTTVDSSQAGRLFPSLRNHGFHEAMSMAAEYYRRRG